MPYMWLMLGTGIFGACVIVRAGNQYLYPSLVIYGREWVEPKQFSPLHVESKSQASLATLHLARNLVLLAVTHLFL